MARSAEEQALVIGLLATFTISYVTLPKAGTLIVSVILNQHNLLVGKTFVLAAVAAAMSAGIGGKDRSIVMAHCGEDGGGQEVLSCSDCGDKLKDIANEVVRIKKQQHALPYGSQ